MEKTPVTLVRATSRDWKTYKELYLSCLKSSPTAFPNSYQEAQKTSNKEWKERLVDTARVIFFAKVDGVAIGMFGARFNRMRKIQHYVEFISFYVHPEFQGQGIGTQLMNRVLRHVTARKTIVKIVSNIYEGRDASLHLHIKNGFTQVATLEQRLKIGKKYYNQYLLEKII